MTSSPGGQGNRQPESQPLSRREWLLVHLPTSRRRRLATIAAIGAILVATFIASSRLLLLLFQELDLLAYAGLFIACWIGAGGALVPIPGVRAASWLMLIQQGAALDPIVVALIAATAMLLGQTSYFIATRAAIRRAREAAEQVPSTLPPETAAPALPGEPDDPATQGGLADEPVVQGTRARYMAGARSRVEGQIRHHGIATVFAVCALPSPMTTLATTAAASSGMRYLSYLPAAFAGFLVLSTVLALVGEGLLHAVRSLLP